MSEQLLRVFNFEVELRGSAVQTSGASGTRGAASGGGPSLGAGGFQECNGLEVELDVQELVEGGRNDGVIRRVGRGKYANIVLKRGMFYAAGGGEAGLDRRLWRWLQGIAAGERPVQRYDGFIRVIDDGGVIATWSFVRGLPTKLSGPQLNAKSGDIAIEELHIAHEGLQLEDF